GCAHHRRLLRDHRGSRLDLVATQAEGDERQRGGNADRRQQKDRPPATSPPSSGLKLARRHCGGELVGLLDDPRRVRGALRAAIEMRTQRLVRLAAKRGEIGGEKALPGVGTGHDRYSSTILEWCASMRWRI